MNVMQFIHRLVKDWGSRDLSTKYVDQLTNAGVERVAETGDVGSTVAGGEKTAETGGVDIVGP